QVPVSKSPCDLECRKRVLGRLTGPAPVGERDRSWLNEERVHVSRSRIPPSPTTWAERFAEPVQALPGCPAVRLIATRSGTAGDPSHRLSLWAAGDPEKSRPPTASPATPFGLEAGR